MSSVEALEPLRQMAGATAAAWAKASRWSWVSTGRHLATVNGPSSPTSGSTRPAPTRWTAKRVIAANHASEGESVLPLGVSDSQTAAPNGSSSTDGTGRWTPLGSSSTIRPSSPYEIGVSCHSSPVSALHLLRPNPPYSHPAEATESPFQPHTWSACERHVP